MKKIKYLATGLGLAAMVLAGTPVLAASTGDLLQQALDLTVANGPRVLELACADGAISMRLATKSSSGLPAVPGLTAPS